MKDDGATAASTAKGHHEWADSLPQMIWIADSEGVPHYFNRLWIDFTGLDNAEAWRKALHPDDLMATVAAWNQSVASGTPFQSEYRFRRAVDGTYRWFLGRALPIRDQQGKILEWHGTGTDIHDHKMAEIALRDAKDEIERVNASKDQFLAMISHELRTPLNAVLGWTQLIQLGLMDPEETIEAINSIEKSAKAQAQLIEDILDVSRIMNNKLRIELQPLFIADCVKLALRGIHPISSAKRIQVFSEIDDGLVALVDNTRLQQVVSNLLTNAVKFTPLDGEIKVRTYRQNQWVCIEVTDSGIGISPEFLPYVFERFRQADASSTRQHGGLGLGLAIVKTLVEIHHGVVRAESEGPGKGSRFTVLLPMAPIKPLDIQEPIPSDKKSVVRLASLNQLRCLVVEDDLSAREFVATLLRKYGAQVRTASAVEEAWALFQTETPDLVVSDLAMPMADGYELIRRIRGLDESRGGAVPAIALTAYASTQDRSRALEKGFNRHLSKPVEPEDLLSAVIASKTDLELLH